MKTGVRFSPPSVTIDDGLRWILHRGLGTILHTPPGRLTGAGPALVRRAERFGLAQRLGARIPFTELKSEVGEEAARLFKRRHQGAVADELAFASLVEEVAQVAALRRIPVVVLKGVALQLARRTMPGSRATSDVDLLVPRALAGELASALCTRGFEPEGLPSTEHHLAPLRRKGMGVVELHRDLPGVRASALGGRVDADALLEGGHCRPVPGIPGCWLPAEELVLAHLIVHGLVQHGYGASYPLTRLIADLQDLGCAGHDRPEAFAGTADLVGECVGRDELSALVALARGLHMGEDPATVAAEDSGRGLMLRHALAVVEDDGYRASLRLQAIAPPLGGGPSGARFLAALLRSLWLTPTQMDVVYGKPQSRWGYLKLRLSRPGHLLVRACRIIRARQAMSRL